MDSPPPLHYHFPHILIQMEREREWERMREKKGSDQKKVEELCSLFEKECEREYERERERVRVGKREYLQDNAVDVKRRVPHRMHVILQVSRVNHINI